MSRFLLISSLAARVAGALRLCRKQTTGEEVLRSTARDLDWTILRPPAVYGPGDREMLPLLQWIRRGMLFVPGGGDRRFSLIFIADLREAILTWLTSGRGRSRLF